MAEKVPVIAQLRRMPASFATGKPRRNRLESTSGSLHYCCYRGLGMAGHHRRAPPPSARCCHLDPMLVIRSAHRPFQKQLLGLHGKIQYVEVWRLNCHDHRACLPDPASNDRLSHRSGGRRAGAWVWSPPGPPPPFSAASAGAASAGKAG